MTSELRQMASNDHQYIRVIGQVREFEGILQIVANDVHQSSTGNELTYHLLEVVHSYEKGSKMQSQHAMGMGGGAMGYGICRRRMVEVWE